MPPAEKAEPIPEVRKGKVTYIFQPDPHYPFVAAGIFFLGGRNEESETNAGLTHFMFRSIAKGTSKLNAEQIAFRFDALGNTPRFSCYRDVSGFTFEALPESFSEMWELLMHCMYDSRFPETEIVTEKGKVLSAIRRNLDDNFVRPLQLFQRAYYGSHPYGLPENGFEQTVQNFNTESLLSWRSRMFHSERVLVAVAGNFDANELFQKLEKGFANLPTSGPEILVPPPVLGPVFTRTI